MRTHRRPSAIHFGALFSAFLAFSAWSTPAGADLEGQWKQSPLKETYTVQQWLPGCGPAPVSMSTGGGETVQVRQEGDELSFVGAGRVFQTNQCYDPMPTLARDAHSRDPSGRSWTTRCTTPAGDPRRALMQTRVTVTSDSHIDLAETGRYEITLQNGRCIADISRSRSWDIVTAAPVASATASAPAPVPTQVEKPANACTTPGEPARLEVRPSKKILKTGESFAFQAVVRDANGCATSTPTTWSLVSSADGKNRVTVDDKGNVTAAADAAEGEQTIDVSAAGKTTHVVVQVSSAADYDALLAQSGLNAMGQSDEASVVTIATGSIGGQDAKATGEASHRRNLFLVIIGSMAALLFVVAFFATRRSRKAEKLEREADARHQARIRDAEERQREKVAEHAAAMRAHEASIENATRVAKEQEEILKSQAMACPACHREYQTGQTYCPSDGSKLVPVSGNEAALSGPAGGICPTCKRGFDASVKVCPDDGDELVAYALRPGPASVAPTRGKICPTCGDRFVGSASFCGKDGTALVLLN
ncbi:MAG TPA: hypothetical protein VF407_04345 [Polyangiaceae bacterium]